MYVVRRALSAKPFNVNGILCSMEINNVCTRYRNRLAFDNQLLTCFVHFHDSNATHAENSNMSMSNYDDDELKSATIYSFVGYLSHAEHTLYTVSV